VRMKAEDFQVDDPDKAMERFRASLARLVKVPKSVVHKRKKSRPKRKRKS